MITLSVDLTGPGTASARGFIAKIIRIAAERGIDQAGLAARAGISAASLSRLKKAGSCRLTTALELARVAGFETLDLGGRPAGRIAASMAAGKLSAGRRLAISAGELVSALASGRPRQGHKAHLYGFFEELPIEAVHDLILDENLDYARLALLAEDLGVEGETVDWLAEMAGDSLANPA